MPGPFVPRRLSRAPGFKASVLGRGLFGVGCALAFLASQSDCGFPSYDFTPTGSGAAGSSGAGPAGAGGSGGLGNSGNTPAVDAGAAGDAGASGSAPCFYQPPVTYPDHCFDGFTGDNETGADCGGPDCLPCETSQPCIRDSDCASTACTRAANVCTQVLALQYMSIVADAFTDGPKFKLLITYMDSNATPLDQLRIRYYFNHNGVTEPVIALDTQATLSAGGTTMDLGSKLNAVVHRLPPGAPAQTGKRVTDSYLEITFSSVFQLMAGATLDITADIVAGSAEVPFQQATHYSFANVGTLTPTDTISVFRGSQRVWGVEPPLVEFPACAFAAGVNLGGPAVTLGENGAGPVLEASGDQLTFSGTLYSSATPKPLPIADVATTKLLSTAFTFTSADTATWHVPSGKYWLYAWLTSADSADSGLLSVQDTPLDKFHGLQRSSGSGWAQLGPYPILVRADGLSMTATGKVNVAGLVLYTQQP